MKAYILYLLPGIIFGFFILNTCSAQDVIASGGGLYSNTTGQISWTLGEGSIGSFSSSNAQVTEGFHQGYLMIVGIKSYTEVLKLKLYPNPTSNKIQIELTDNQENWGIKILDINGKLLLERQFIGSVSKAEIDVSGQAAGTYIIQTLQEDKLISISKLIKTNSNE